MVRDQMDNGCVHAGVVVGEKLETHLQRIHCVRNAHGEIRFGDDFGPADIQLFDSGAQSLGILFGGDDRQFQHFGRLQHSPGDVDDLREKADTRAELLLNVTHEQRAGFGRDFTESQ